MGCGKPLHELSHVVNVDHIDGNKNNNPDDYSNYQLLCNSCNIEKWHKQKYLTSLDVADPNSLTLKVGSKMEYQYIRWLYAMIIKNKAVHYKIAIFTGALEISGSPESTKRYLKKHTTDPNHDKAIFHLYEHDLEPYVKLSPFALSILKIIEFATTFPGFIIN